MLGTMAMHMLVPALPAMAQDLGAPAAAVQQTVTLYVLGLAVGPTFYGPMSDRYGRRPLLIAGLLLYLAATVAAALAASIEQLMAARVAQALGGAAGLALGRAMVRDASGSDVAAARAMAVLSTGISIAPAISAPVGGYLAAWLGWRLTFGVVGLAVVAALLLAFTVLPETLRHRNREAGVATMLRAYPRLLGLRRYIGYAAGGACSYGFYAYFAASPFIITSVLQRPAENVGLCYFLACIAIAAGNFTSSRIVGRITPAQLARLGNALHIAGALLLLAADASGNLTIVTLVAPTMVVAFGAGMAAPNAATLAVSAAPGLVGAASSLYSSLLMIAGGLSTAAVSFAAVTSAMPTALTFLASGVIGQLLYWYAGPAPQAKS